MATGGWRIPVHCVGSSPVAFGLLFFVARRHCALLRLFVLLIPHEGMYHILCHDNSMVAECCVTSTLRRTWGSPCRLLDVWIVYHELRIQCKSRMFFEA